MPSAPIPATPRCCPKSQGGEKRRALGLASLGVILPALYLPAPRALIRDWLKSGSLCTGWTSIKEAVTKCLQSSVLSTVKKGPGSNPNAACDLEQATLLLQTQRLHLFVRDGETTVSYFWYWGLGGGEDKMYKKLGESKHCSPGDSDKQTICC